MIYDPSDKENRDKIWHATPSLASAQQKWDLGEANRTIRATGMNPTSSRGHTIFQVRFSKLELQNKQWKAPPAGAPPHPDQNSRPIGTAKDNTTRDLDLITATP